MRIRRTPILLASVAASAAIASVLTEAQAEPESKPLVLTVRPSRYDAEDPRARQEKLLKRLEQSDYWVRSICTHCGDSWKHQVYAPFNPLDALGSHGSDGAASE